MEKVNEFEDYLLNVMKNCRKCWGLGILNETCPPRGWAGNYKSPEKVKYVFVTLNPATPKVEEEQYFKKHIQENRDFLVDDLRFVVEDIANAYLLNSNLERDKRKVFHKNLSYAIKQLLMTTTSISPYKIIDNFLDYVWVTDFFKCDTQEKFGVSLKKIGGISNQRKLFLHCLKHLFVELNYFNPIAVIVMEKAYVYQNLTITNRTRIPPEYDEIYDSLRKWSNKIYYFPHPSSENSPNPNLNSVDYKTEINKYIQSFYKDILNETKI